jgi:hypothetical protein
MAQKNNGLIVFGSLVVIGSVGYYLWSKSKKSKGAGSSEPTPTDAPTQTPTTQPTSKGSPQGTPKTQPKVDEFLKIEDYLYDFQTISAFQDWMDANHPNWVSGKNLNKGSGYGLYVGKNTRKAWQNYGKEYANLRSKQGDVIIEQNRINAIRKLFPKGKDVIANITFRAFATDVRNGIWYSTDSNGEPLPSKEFKATANVGKVWDVLSDGNVIVNVYNPISSGAFGKNYFTIKVKPTWIK